MRITNKVMQNNALTNINRNKELQDSLTTQLSTGKKIYKPSDDPVTAIRALRLRSDVNQTSQYCSKNVPDANSWLELTESSIKTTVSVITDMIVQCEKGSNDTLTTSDRDKIINSLKQLKSEVYSTGDADFAGRYIFAGYRTETSLSFKDNTKQTYTITELFKANDIKQETYVECANLSSLSESNYEAGTGPAIMQQDIDANPYYKIRMSYSNIDSTNTPTQVTMNGTTYAVNLATDKNAAYADAANDSGVYFIPSTGELVFGKSVFDDAKNSTDNISITYDKTNWVSGDLRPQHYFYCETVDEDGNVITFNDDDNDNDGQIDYFKTGTVDQSIEYQVGFNQYIRVNTNANEVFKHSIGRDIDDLMNLADTLSKMEDIQSKLKLMSTNTTIYSASEIDNIKLDLDAADKAVSYLRDQLHEKFSSTITSMQSYLDDTNEAVSLVGNRTSRLSLIENRLSSQTTTFKTLQSDNEDADATEVAVQLSSAEISYKAALMATSDMIKETLLNYL